LRAIALARGPAWVKATVRHPVTERRVVAGLLQRRAKGAFAASSIKFAAHRRMWQCSIKTKLCIDVIFNDHMMVIVDDDCAMQTATPNEGSTTTVEATPGCEQKAEG
jgi:hypothetical protein